VERTYRRAGGAKGRGGGFTGKDKGKAGRAATTMAQREVRQRERLGLTKSMPPIKKIDSDQNLLKKAFERDWGRYDKRDLRGEGK